MTLKSMTAYGRGQLVSEIGIFALEIQSLNRKHLDINVLLPREFSFLEQTLREWISEKISRGVVTLKLTVAYEAKSPVSVKPDLGLVREIYHAYGAICDELSLPKTDINLTLLANHKDILQFLPEKDSEEKYKELLKKVFGVAIHNLLEMKEFEGKALRLSIEEQLKRLKNSIDLIDANSQNSVDKYREKLRQSLSEFLSGKQAETSQEDKILREICIFAEKVDVTEEITRFRAHLDHFKKILFSEERAKGRSLEFLLQEFGREINTIGSKSLDIFISHQVVDMKKEVEKIREQIQNVE